MTNLKKQLLPIWSQQSELETFLTSFFGQSVQKELNKIVHGGCLEVNYNRDNTKIKSIYLTKKLEIKDKLISEANEALASNHGDQIYSVFGLTSSRVEGFYRFEDSFQILPPPISAPQSEYLNADHPFTLEYSVPKSTNMKINITRSNKRLWEISMLLNSLLRDGIKPRYRSTTEEWVTIIDGESTRSEYLTLGYYGGIDNREKEPDGFTSVKDYKPLPTINGSTYYDSPGISLEDMEGLTVPDNLDDLIIKFERLSDFEKKKFLRASFWSQIANKIFNYSWSASYNSLVTSVEVFLPSSTLLPDNAMFNFKKAFLQTLGKYNTPSGPTKEFRDFVEKYAPGIPEDLRKQLYQTRSKITHGGFLMPADESEAGFVFSSKFNEARKNWLLLSRLVQAVQISWLISR